MAPLRVLLDVESDIRAVVEKSGDDVIVKVILENAYLDDSQKVRAVSCGGCGADDVKTLTSYPTGGASQDLELMRASSGPRSR